MTATSAPGAPAAVPAGLPASQAAAQDAAAAPSFATGIPREGARLVARPRLDGPLDALTAGSLAAVGVWGAAGSGKTTLLSGWARRLHEQGAHVTWYSPALGGVGGIGSLAAAPPAGPASYVFIDDVHLLDPAVAGQCLHLIEAARATGSRVVLAGRWEPFSTASLRTTGAMAELRGDDLAFTVGEATALSERHSISLSPVAVESLVVRTGGWAAGLALAMPWLHASENTARAVSLFDGDNRAVADYLVSEIVANLSSDDRDVLMASAVRSVVPLELAGLLAGRTDAGAILRRLSQRNTLITEEPGELAYRYHPVLLAFMQAEAWRRDSAGAESGHAQAMRWLAARGDGPGTVEQAIASRNTSLVSAALSTFAVELVLTGNVSSVIRAVRVLKGAPETLPVLVGRLLLEMPHFGDARLADNIVAAIDALPPTAVSALPPASWGAAPSPLALTTPPPGEAYWRTLFGVLLAFRATGAANLAAQLALLDSPAVQRVRRSDLAVDLLAATATGWCLSRLNRLAEAETIYIDVAQSARSAGYEWLFLLAADLGATAASRNGHWMLAGTLESQMADAAGSTSSPTDRRSARSTLLLLTRQYERGEPVSPNVLEKLANSDAASADFGVVVPATTLMLLVALDSGANPRLNLDRLYRLMAETGAGHPRSLGASCVRLYDLTSSHDGRTEGRAIIRLVESSLGHDSLEAELLRFVSAPGLKAHEPVELALEAALAQSRYSWRGSTVVSAWLALAELAERTGRHSDADARVMAALRVASQLGVERPFLHFGGQGASLVKSRLGRLGSFDDFAGHIVERAGAEAAAETTAESSDGVRFGVLTRREHELLRELPLHQTVIEIAAKQSVSANTAKTHLRSIYSKLGASDRAQAVAIARRRGLI